MPLDGDARAAYALRRDDGEFEFRRVEYDVERAARRGSLLPGWGSMVAQRLRKGSD
jgi:diadenosine tetraphosphatase ApaH/serine/threonine PP2A family protein phosphatase